MKLILHKFKKLFKLTKCFFSSEYASLYYTELANSKLQSVGENLKIYGRIEVTDWRQLVIGKNVQIGKNCVFISEGGVYVEDNCKIPDNTIVDTRIGNFDLKKLGYETLKNIHSIFIMTNTIFELNKVIKPNVNINYKIDGYNLIDKNNRFFIVSTGRSGTNSIANTLDSLDEIYCKHEPRHVMNRLSTEFAHKIKSKDQVLYELYFMFYKCDNIRSSKKLIGECDWKYSNLIPLLRIVLPKAKFVWLIRNAQDFVSSAYGRGWFDQYEYNYPFAKEFSKDTIAGMEIFNHYRMEYSIYRINGYGIGVFSKDQWLAMSAFERCCWFWAYWNLTIENLSIDIPSELFFTIRLEDFNKDSENLMNFLGISCSSKIEIKHTNKAYYDIHNRLNWSDDQIQIFMKYCSEGMKKWYNIHLQSE